MEMRRKKDLAPMTIACLSGTKADYLPGLHRQMRGESNA